jgi:hypothetical protein
MAWWRRGLRPCLDGFRISIPATLPAPRSPTMVTQQFSLPLKPSPSVRLIHRQPLLLQDWRKELEQLGETFAAARLEIEDARENAGTVYFKDDYHSASEIVVKAQTMYQELLGAMPEEEAGRLKREQGPKMGQLAEELSQLDQFLH